MLGSSYKIKWWGCCLTVFRGGWTRIETFMEIWGPKQHLIDLVHMLRKRHGLIEFEVSNTTVSTVFHQPIKYGQGHDSTSVCRCTANFSTKVVLSKTFWGLKFWGPLILGKCTPQENILTRGWAKQTTGSD